MSALAERMCKPLPAGTPALTQAKIDEYLKQVPGWAHRGGAIVKSFSFKNYYETMAFVNTIAWIAHREDHHPDITLAYNKCQVAWNTHSVGGISMNDFICAAKIEALCKM
jgi:4a-hydroxytetrahydrobiopterin dehydratase